MEEKIVSNGQPGSVSNGQPSFEGLSQYRPPLCYELAGREFTLCMDSGYDYRVKFLDGQKLVWGLLDGQEKEDAYECLKGDETTYFVNVEVEGAKPRTGLSLVLDLTNDLATCLIARQGENPKVPYLISNEVVFGAILRADGTLNSKRHGYTRDMVGSAVEWVYSPDFRIIHVYCSERYYRVAMPKPTEMSQRNLDDNAAMLEAFQGYPDATEPALYIKIKDGMYFFSFIEEHLERLTRETTRGNNLAFLMNFERMYDVGRSFGINSRQLPENYLFGAYGRFVELPPETFNYQSPYFV